MFFLPVKTSKNTLNDDRIMEFEEKKKNDKKTLWLSGQ